MAFSIYDTYIEVYGNGDYEFLGCVNSNNYYTSSEDRWSSWRRRIWFFERDWESWRDGRTCQKKKEILDWIVEPQTWTLQRALHIHKRTHSVCVKKITQINQKIQECNSILSRAKIRLEFWYCTFFVYTILNFPLFWRATLSREKAWEIQNSVIKNSTISDF